MIAMERTRVIQTEKNAQDAQVVRSTQEESLKALTEQQSLSLATMSKELMQANENIQKLASQTKAYEVQLNEQRHQSQEMNDRLAQAREQISRLSSELKTKELILQDLMQIQTDEQGRPVGHSELDRKILDELQSTKTQLKTYEVDYLNIYLVA
jgi:chromosome segregation ATPase